MHNLIKHNSNEPKKLKTMKKNVYMTPSISVVKIDTVMPIASSVDYDEQNGNAEIDFSDVTEGGNQSEFFAPGQTNLWED